MIEKRRIEKSLLFVSILIFFTCPVLAQSAQVFFKAQQEQPNRIISIELRLMPDQLKKTGTVSFIPVDYIIYNPTSEEIKISNNGRITIKQKIGEPGYINFSNILMTKERGNYLTEPGDDVVIRYIGNGFQFSGVGAKKYELQYLLDSLERSIPKVNNKTGLASFYLDSMAEFFAWRNYFDQGINRGMRLIEQYSGQLSVFAFALIKDKYIQDKYGDFLEKFNSLVEYGVARQKVATAVLVQIYDSILSPTLARWISYATNSQTMKLSHMRYLLERVFYFEPKRILSKSEAEFYLIKHSFHVYEGTERERLAVNSFPKDLMLGIGFTPEVEQLLAEYYATPDFPEWKKWMKKKEHEVRVEKLSYKVQSFSLPTNTGWLISQKNLEGKIAILYFNDGDEVWENKKTALLQHMMSKYKKDSEVVLIDISTEKDNVAWQQRIGKIDFTEKKIIYASTGGWGGDHEIIRQYAVTKFPWIWIMSPEGKILNTDQKWDTIQNDIELLSAFIQVHMDYFKAKKQKEVSAKQDGPYVFYEDNGKVLYSIDDKKLNRTKIEIGETKQLLVQTDLEKKFTLTLQRSFYLQPAEYPAVEKLLALSDIEGNFDALRKLLQKNKVIDDNFNWTFGKGHLVFAGDMFDRGDQVTECLWLLYSLEEKAKQAGGYVHFVLGNHDIMNMQGLHFYTEKKYVNNSKLMGKSLTALYNEDSEIGRWLRTKNVIEKIGDILFLHAGISPEVNRSSLSISEINKKVRPYYGRIIDSTDKELLMLYDSRKGENYRISPFWSRSYYKGKRISNDQLDTTLSKFNVRHIVTGHTIVADTISVHYNNKVLNIDTNHKKGKSEALLIEGNYFYRVNFNGGKVLLFKDDTLKKF